MTLTQHLDQIYQLVCDRADPAKVRGHIELIRDQVSAASNVEAKFRKQIAHIKKSHAKEMAELDAKLLRLERENKKIVALYEQERAPRKLSRAEQLEAL